MMHNAQGTKLSVVPFAGHSHVNHVLAQLPPDADNPFEKGSHAVP